MESSIFVLKNRRIPEKTSEREEEERVNHLRSAYMWVSISSSSSNSKLAMSMCLFFTSIISLMAFIFYLSVSFIGKYSIFSASTFVTASTVVFPTKSIIFL